MILWINDAHTQYHIYPLVDCLAKKMFSCQHGPVLTDNDLASVHRNAHPRIGPGHLHWSHLAGTFPGSPLTTQVGHFVLLFDGTRSELSSNHLI